ncbi:peptidoglycan DD-metalloendopeptidase family protein [Flavobacteriaceae bacterium]|nr:peptidoglycan DD-metalloendopeptidase family protein [Flavobacteriaceae bacterium]
MDFKTFLFELSQTPVRVIAPSVDFSAYVPIDLSKDNKALEDFDTSCSQSWMAYINQYLHDLNKSVAFGGYLETRSIYTRSTHFETNNALESRNIHLGVDLWCAAETPVLAAFDGVVHSFQDNTNHGDYGPTIVLKHCINGVTFYTLYGHLSKSSIKTLYKNTQIIKEQVIGYLGDAAVNGDYAPHLHFQIIKNIADYEGDYPGVSSQKDLDFYSANCPDPNLVLKLC